MKEQKEYRGLEIQSILLLKTMEGYRPVWGLLGLRCPGDLWLELSSTVVHMALGLAQSWEESVGTLH